MEDTLTFAVPVEWSKSAAYEQNIIVFVGKRAYTSLKAVPSGVEITDTSYWAETGVPQGSDTTQLKADIETLKGNVSTLQSDLSTTNSNVTANNNAITSIKQDIIRLYNDKADYFTRHEMDAALTQQGIATPLDYANAKNLMTNADKFFSDDSTCVNVLAMAEVISALCAQIDAISESI